MAEHDRNLHGVLSRLAKYNATVRVDKCVIGQPEVEFNGHLISADGLRPLQSNVDSILRIPVPVNQRQLLRYLCTASYYLKFVDGYAMLSEPLRRLLRANADWNWTPDCQHSFDEIKRRLTSPPILAHFDTAAETSLTCDASSVGIAACLSQRRQGDSVERPVAFISRALSPTEQRYSASEREALACMWACERLHFPVWPTFPAVHGPPSAANFINGWRKRPSSTSTTPLGRPPAAVRFRRILQTR